jgi:hypothetical protein
VGQFIFKCPEKKVSKEDRSMMRWMYLLNLREFLPAHLWILRRSASRGSQILDLEVNVIIQLRSLRRSQRREDNREYECVAFCV